MSDVFVSHVKSTGADRQELLPSLATWLKKDYNNFSWVLQPCTEMLSLNEDRMEGNLEHASGHLCDLIQALGEVNLVFEAQVFDPQRKGATGVTGTQSLFYVAYALGKYIYVSAFVVWRDSGASRIGVGLSAGSVRLYSVANKCVCECKSPVTSLVAWPAGQNSLSVAAGCGCSAIVVSVKIAIDQVVLGRELVSDRNKGVKIRASLVSECSFEDQVRMLCKDGMVNSYKLFGGFGASPFLCKDVVARQPGVEYAVSSGAGRVRSAMDKVKVTMLPCTRDSIVSMSFGAIYGQLLLAYDDSVYTINSSTDKPNGSAPSGNSFKVDSDVEKVICVAVHPHQRWAVGVLTTVRVLVLHVDALDNPLVSALHCVPVPEEDGAKNWTLQFVTGRCGVGTDDNLDFIQVSFLPGSVALLYRLTAPEAYADFRFSGAVRGLELEGPRRLDFCDLGGGVCGTASLGVPTVPGNSTKSRVKVTNASSVLVPSLSLDVLSETSNVFLLAFHMTNYGHAFAQAFLVSKNTGKDQEIEKKRQIAYVLPDPTSDELENDKESSHDSMVSSKKGSWKPPTVKLGAVSTARYARLGTVRLRRKPKGIEYESGALTGLSRAETSIVASELYAWLTKQPRNIVEMTKFVTQNEVYRRRKTAAALSFQAIESMVEDINNGVVAVDAQDPKILQHATGAASYLTSHLSAGALSIYYCRDFHIGDSAPPPNIKRGERTKRRKVRDEPEPEDEGSAMVFNLLSQLSQSVAPVSSQEEVEDDELSDSELGPRCMRIPNSTEMETLMKL